MEAAVLIPLAVAAVSAGATAFSGIAEEKAGNIEAAQYKENAAAAKLAGEQDAVARRKQLQRTIAAQQALRAGSGVDLKSGTGLAIEEASRQETESDILASRYNYASEAARYKLAAKGAKQSGKSARIGGFIGGTSKLLSGAGDAYVATH